MRTQKSSAGNRRKKKSPQPPAVATRRNTARAAGRAAAAGSLMRIDRGQKMLEVGSHFVSYYMFLSHRLRPVAGEPDPGSADTFVSQFNDVRRSLLTVLSHHPVLKAKIERMTAEVERMVSDDARLAPGDSRRESVQTEARLLSLRLRENCRAMSDLIAVLRNV